MEIRIQCLAVTVYKLYFATCIFTGFSRAEEIITLVSPYLFRYMIPSRSPTTFLIDNVNGMFSEGETPR